MEIDWTEVDELKEQAADLDISLSDLLLIRNQQLLEKLVDRMPENFPADFWTIRQLE